MYKKSRKLSGPEPENKIPALQRGGLAPALGVVFEESEEESVISMNRKLSNEIEAEMEEVVKKTTLKLQLNYL